MATNKRKISSEYGGSERVLTKSGVKNIVLYKIKKAFSCICNESIVELSCNIKRHFESNHQNVYSMTDEEKKIHYSERNKGTRTTM